MQSPWVCYTNKIREMFKRDPEIVMSWSDETKELHMYVANDAKAAAIAKILPSTKQFGKVTVNIYIHSTDEYYTAGDAYTLEDAFTGNPIFKFARYIPEAFLSNGVYYIVFAKEVIQWFNDDLNDLYANANDLAENIAREIFITEPNVFFCTAMD